MGGGNCRQEYARGGAAILSDTLALARELKDEARRLGVGVQALGVGVAELVDGEGRVFSDHRIRWTGLDAGGQLSQVLPTVISSDVRSAALAEAQFGAGRGARDFYFVTIGTGVAGVLVLDGVPYAGSRGAALVIANSMERHRCPACGHERRGMIEDVASGPALAAAAAQRRLRMCWPRPGEAMPGRWPRSIMRRPSWGGFWRFWPTASIPRCW